MIIKGKFRTLSDCSLGEAAFLKNDHPQYYWPQRRYMTQPGHHHAAILSDLLHVGVWNFYSMNKSCFIKDMSYPGSLQHFKVNHSIERKSPIDDSEISMEISDFKTITDPVFIVGGHDNHYHWLLNWLPRLDIYFRCIESGWNAEFMKRCKFVVHDRISEAHVDSLKVLGINEDRIMKIDINKPILFKEAVLSSFFSSYIYDDRALSFLNKNFYSEKSSQSTPPRFWIYREGIREPKRRIENFSDLKIVFEKYGIKVLTLEEMKFSEQVECFKSAELVIAAHGAGLSNCVFCRPGTDIFLFESKEISEYKELAKRCLLNITTFKCNQHVNVDFEKKNPTFNARFRDLIAPIDEVEEKLKWTIRRREIDIDVLQINNIDALERAAKNRLK